MNKLIFSFATIMIALVLPFVASAVLVLGGNRKNTN